MDPAGALPNDREGSPAEEERRSAALLEHLERASGARCADCSRPVCGHEVVLSVISGYKGEPRCADCLADVLGFRLADLLEHLAQHVERRDCYRAGWRWASRREGFAEGIRPGCLWPQGESMEAVVAIDGRAGGSGDAGDRSAAPAHHAEWDAGDMGCGDLVLELRFRLLGMAPGRVLKLTARDPGAPEDLPAWCGLTGHTLVLARPPDYWIRRRKD